MTFTRVNQIPIRAGGKFRATVPQRFRLLYRDFPLTTRSSMPHDILFHPLQITDRVEPNTVCSQQYEYEISSADRWKADIINDASFFRVHVLRRKFNVN